MFSYSKDSITVASILDSRKPNKRGTSPIKIRVTHNRVRKYYSTGKDLTPSEWEQLPRAKSQNSKLTRESVENSFSLVKANVEALAEKGGFSFDALNLRLSKAKGVFCLIKLKYPERHKEHFEALKIIFKKLGISIDKQCGDVCRLRGYSWDKNAYFNFDAETFTQYLDPIEELEKKMLAQAEPFTIQKKSLVSNNSTEQRVKSIISKISASNADITDTYEDWFKIACALASEFGEGGRQYFQEVSKNYSGYNPGYCDTLFSKCISNSYGYNIGTFFHIAGLYGI